MLKKYGLIGLLMIFAALLLAKFGVEPYVFAFTSLIWYGYIITADSIVNKLKGKSLLSKPRHFAYIASLSIGFWLIFELYNVVLKGWFYDSNGLVAWVFRIIAFSSILPAVFETADLLNATKIFDRFKFRHHNINKNLAKLAAVAGMIFLLLPLVYTKPLSWVFVWTGFLLLFDPINYLQKERSIIGDFQHGKFGLALALFFSGYIAGFLWEFWNKLAHSRWSYTVPILENIRVFEIPALGFLAYGFFALELFAMYIFVSSLIKKLRY